MSRRWYNVGTTLNPVEAVLDQRALDIVVRAVVYVSAANIQLFSEPPAKNSTFLLCQLFFLHAPPSALIHSFTLLLMRYREAWLNVR